MHARYNLGTCIIIKGGKVKSNNFYFAKKKKHSNVIKSIFINKTTRTFSENVLPCNSFKPVLFNASRTVKLSATDSAPRIHLPSKRQNQWRHFQLSVESDQRLLWFYFTFLCDWSGKLAPLSQPIRYNPKTNKSLVTRVFPRFKQFACFYFES